MKEIILCSECEGRGYIYRHELTCYHKGEYDVHLDTCKTCDGKGRLYKITTITYEKLQEEN